jgi:hypothetical protein
MATAGDQRGVGPERAFHPQLAAGETVTLSDEESAHLVRVRRVARGEAVVCYDGRGGSFVGTLTHADPRAAQVTLDAPYPSREPGLRVTVAASIPEPVQGLDVDEIADSLRRIHFTGLLPADIKHLANVIQREALRQDLSPALVLALIRVESSGYNFAKSNKGAMGLMQLLPTTAAWVAEKIGDPWDGPDSLFESDTNVRLGIAYLRQMVNRYDGSVPRALAAYNWGPGRISGFIRAGKAVPTGYADRVLSTYGEVQAREV